MDSSSERKARHLGVSFGAAANQLRKRLLFKYVSMAGDAKCYRCGCQIESVEQFSVEHKQPWQSSPDPKDAFFSQDNIAFSHLRCNISFREPKEECPRGHTFTEENTRTDRNRRECIECNRIRNREHYRNNLRRSS
jgi:hypothetical protein